MVGQCSRNMEEKKQSMHQWGMKTLKNWAVFDLLWEEIYEWSFFSWRHSLSFEWVLSSLKYTSTKHLLHFYGFFLWYVWRRIWHVPITSVWVIFFYFSFFGHEVWPNYTRLHYLVSNECDGKHVYIVFFIYILLIFLLVFKKEVNSLLHSGLIGFENGEVKRSLGPDPCALCIQFNNNITMDLNILYISENF